MKRWGITFIFIALASFILPLFGLQFNLVNALGPSGWAVLLTVGLVLFALGSLRQRSSRRAAPAASRPAPRPAAQTSTPPAPPPAEPAQPVHTRHEDDAAPHFCGNCGHALTTGQHFCSNCGAPVS